MKPTQHLSILALISLAALAGVAQAASPTQTIKNLNTAFQGESNASQRYAKFAAKADSEGYPQVAKLFRAASAAEAIHRDTHKEAILKAGGKVETFQLDEVVVGNTAENLRSAIKGESHERDNMYPEYLATAKQEDNRAAIRTLQFALAAEKEHAVLYQEALNTLGRNAHSDYFVCQVCGMTLKALPDKKCPSCRKSRDEYKKVS